RLKSVKDERQRTKLILELKRTCVSYQTHLRFFTPSLVLMKSIKNTAEKTLKISPAASYTYKETP
ncbi:hypothetical protein, partial [Phocaeicola plebeius]|uniref:hypothetical protein n=1 Tax=Phocaeicola plebeius TaxID=310297 RepID=UPI0026EF7D32